MDIRFATIEDAEAILRIYEPYVKNTAITFEYEVPTIEEFRERVKNTLKQYPYLVLEENENIAGYAYASQFHPRAAYSHCAELSIYIDPRYHGKGYGKKLYTYIEEILAKQNIYTVHACVASPEKEDEHLTNHSELFHTHMGFRLVGRHEKCGYKFGTWYSMLWMDKALCEHPAKPEDFIPFSNLTL